MSQVQERVTELQRQAFLVRLYQLCGGDDAARVDAGAVGAELGLPLEQTLEIVAALHEQGALHRCGKLSPPDGPEVHLTRQGVSQAHQAA